MRTIFVKHTTRNYFTTTMINQTIFQFFHWYFPKEANLWRHGADQAAYLASLGVTQVWLPPAYKSWGDADEPGYAVYDLFDLGEFDQKGEPRTRFGTKDEYINCVKALQSVNIRVLADTVLNHKHGGDEKETIHVTWVDKDDRRKKISEDQTTEAYTKFTFPGRQGKYSQFIWDYQCFSGISDGEKIAIILNEYTRGEWDKVLDDEMGNYDYLMGNDIEFRNPLVREELTKWGQWYVQTTGVDGFRLDALKHINPDFYPEWLQMIKDHFQRDFSCIGEYWKSEVGKLVEYIDYTKGLISLFDVPLHYNFCVASAQKENYDLRKILDGALVKERPDKAVTFVDNHDTQPLQSLESFVDYWFKPLANAIILLREGGWPCIFYPSVYAARYTGQKDGQDVTVELAAVPGLVEMMKVRSQLAYGPQHDYFDHGNVIGWTREGDNEHEGGCAVLMSNGQEGNKKMYLGKPNAHKKYIAICGNRQEMIELDDNGEGEFWVNGSAVSVWVLQEKKW